MTSQIATGSFVNVASTPYFLPLNMHVSRFDIMNLSKLSSYTSARITNATWYDYMSNGIAIVDAPTTVTGPLNASAVIRTQLAQGGISVFNSANPIVYPVVAIASYTPGTTTVWTTGTAHGYQVGDNVRVYGLTSVSGSNQFNGLTMTVTAVGSSTTFTTLLNTSGGTTSTGSVQKVGNVSVQNSALYYPQNRVIAKITQANPMVVTTLVAQNYAVGDVVTFLMPSVFGMNQLAATNTGKPFLATITAVNNAVGTQTVTFGGVDSTNFTAFGGSNSANGWPASSSYPFSFPIMVPNNEGNINNIFNVTPAPLPYGNQDVLSFATQNTGASGILIGAGDGTAAATTGGLIGSTTDTWVWTAFGSRQSFPQLPQGQ